MNKMIQKNAKILIIFLILLSSFFLFSLISCYKNTGYDSAVPYGIDAGPGSADDENLVENEEENVPMIKMEEVYEIVKNEDHSYIILDVSLPDTYKREHIPGAINIMYGKLPERFNELDKSKQIIVYCIDVHCGTSKEAVKFLLKNGFTKVFAMDKGISEWKEKNYPLTK